MNQVMSSTKKEASSTDEYIKAVQSLVDEKKKAGWNNRRIRRFLNAKGL